MDKSISPERKNALVSGNSIAGSSKGGSTGKVLEDIQRRFSSHRLVFWHDTDRVYADELDELMTHLPDVALIRLDNEPMLGVKTRIEIDEPDQPFLLFSEKAKPEPRNDWLLDVRLYSDEVAVGFAALMLEELGLKPESQLALQAVRDFIEKHRSFFKNRQRIKKLKRVLDVRDDHAQLEKKMLGVLLNSDRYDIVSLLTQLYNLFSGQFESAEDINWEVMPQGWNDLCKFGLENAFWALVAQEFSYDAEVPKLAHLLCCLMVSDFNYSALTSIPTALESKILKGSRATNNTVVTLSAWRDSISWMGSYNQLSSWVEKELNIDSLLASLEIEHLVDAKTFAAVERYIASVLRDRILQDNTLEHPRLAAGALKNMVQQRLEGYWASPVSNNDTHQGFRAVYKAFDAALNLLTAVEDFKNDTSDSPADLYQAYENQYFFCDMHYRIYRENADQVTHWGILTQLTETIENTYVNTFMAPFALKWDRHFGGEFLSRWTLPQIPNQFNFFKERVATELAKDSKRKIFVIVSDAMRYEVAHELNHHLAGISRVQSELSSQLGVLPSYTALGKAALLPRKDTISFVDSTVKVDGANCVSIEERNRVLAAFDGCALDFEETKSLNKTMGRERFKDSRVIYIFHDAIDAKGDKEATEQEAFAAVRQTVEELKTLVNKIVNSWNGTQVFITSDHGFIYQTSKVSELDKSPASMSSGMLIKENKRYLIGTGIDVDDQVHHGKLSITSGVSGPEEFVLPKGVKRFHFKGGARFVHGGLLAQETVVPVIEARLKRGQSAHKQRVSDVDVVILGDNHRITTPTHYFTMLQASVVSEKVKAVSLRAEIRDSSGKAVSDQQILTFDSASASMDERKKRVRFTLKALQFDRKAQYYLVLEKADTRSEVMSQPVLIDIAFFDDF
ncbi:BREX-1 system phosphatase PglZ type A [Endozoicomonas gorgoniicola]|uniref:BREX-1 system phosphatase PglZ type A n=1 Tax=Endozoicomonas gorgoniicola TaxID=1234144 RepID=A0ABT3MU09_9GAMM|nr:BREX-1 system phosphatase PglZ type A [Endozoicomonas gorgoniicola]MCW7552859.1 BREX-1 system phosphatase PglZ type A [Endozoicomonas gorgoniicola]